MNIEAEAIAAQAAASGAHAAQPQGGSVWAGVHRDLSMVGHALTRVYPLVQAIAEDPRVDELVYEALEASRAGVAAEVFQAATDALRAAHQRKSAAPQPGQAGA